MNFWKACLIVVVFATVSIASTRGDSCEAENAGWEALMARAVYDDDVLSAPLNLMVAQCNGGCDQMTGQCGGACTGCSPPYQCIPIWPTPLCGGQPCATCSCV